MLKATLYKAPGLTIQKLLYLLEVLKTERNKYTHAASTIENRQLRDSINTLAQENNQYACELNSQLQILGAGNPATGDTTTEKWEHGKYTFKNIADDNMQNAEEILKICRDSEKQVISAYREVLNEPYLMEDMRRLIRTQLNGIMFAFLRLKLFSSAL